MQSIAPKSSTYQSKICKLEGINPDARTCIVTDLSRIFLFKGFNGDVIDRTTFHVEALGENMKKGRVMMAALNKAYGRLRDVFGFAVYGGCP